MNVSNKYVLKAYVDTREQKFVKKTIAFFKTKGVEIESKTLGDLGDVAILLKNKEWLNIERKSYSDFVTSYISGHLQDQCIRMGNSSNYPCIIVYGSLKDLKSISYKYPALKKIKQRSIDKMVRNIQINYRIPIFFVEKEAHYFLEIMNIAETICEKGGDVLKKKPAVSLRKRPDIEIVMGANRVGEKTALNLLKEFKTPEKVFNASREDLLKINGIGDATISDLKAWRRVFYEGV